MINKKAKILLYCILLFASIALLAFWLNDDLELDSRSVEKDSHAIPHTSIATSPTVARVDPPVETKLKALDPEFLRSKRSEFKMNLSMLYSAQKAFIADYGRYSTDLHFIGWSPTESNMDYKLGFLKADMSAEPVAEAGQAEDWQRMTTDSFLGFATEPGNKDYKYSDLIGGIDINDFSHYCKMGCTVRGDKFEMLLVAQLNGMPSPDVWLINEKKELVHVRDGLTGKDL